MPCILLPHTSFDFCCSQARIGKIRVFLRRCRSIVPEVSASYTKTHRLTSSSRLCLISPAYFQTGRAGWETSTRGEFRFDWMVLPRHRLSVRTRVSARFGGSDFDLSSTHSGFVLSCIGWRSVCVVINTKSLRSPAVVWTKKSKNWYRGVSQRHYSVRRGQCCRSSFHWLKSKDRSDFTIQHG